MNQLIPCIHSFNLNHSPMGQERLLRFSRQKRKMRLRKPPELAQGQTQVCESKACVLSPAGTPPPTGQGMMDPSPPVGTA